jgi:hypothetical protein
VKVASGGRREVQNVGKSCRNQWMDGGRKISDESSLVPWYPLIIKGDGLQGEWRYGLFGRSSVFIKIV